MNEPHKRALVSAYQCLDPPFHTLVCIPKSPNPLHDREHPNADKVGPVFLKIVESTCCRQCISRILKPEFPSVHGECRASPVRGHAAVFLQRFRDASSCIHVPLPDADSPTPLSFFMVDIRTEHETMLDFPLQSVDGAVSACPNLMQTSRGEVRGQRLCNEDASGRSYHQEPQCPSKFQQQPPITPPLKHPSCIACR